MERLAAFGADALVSIQYDQILKGPLFDRIGCPCLNIHFALLPRHRGVAPIAWAVLAGDSEAGVTLHHMIEDIDAGDIVAQRAVPIAPDGTAREVYDALTNVAIQVFQESYPFAPGLLHGREPQSTGDASYHRQGDLDFSIRQVDWTRPAWDLQRWIRARIFPPMQYPETTWHGQVVTIRRVAGEIGAAAGVPAGTVVTSTDGLIEVAAGDGLLRLTDVSIVEASADAVKPGDVMGEGGASR